jgi:hypothetical protein
MCRVALVHPALAVRSPLVVRSVHRLGRNCYVCRMALTENRILQCRNDDELFELLGLELTSRFPNGEGETEEDLDAFVAKLRTLPVGLRAMASIYQLDVSLALDDLGWHSPTGITKPIAWRRCGGCASLRPTKWLTFSMPPTLTRNDIGLRLAICWRWTSTISRNGTATRSLKS